MPELSSTTLAYIAAAIALVGLMAYASLAGADFGGGVWDLFATGRRKRQQREAIAHAMGPVWEANHVWLIFVLVVLFTCFPLGYSALMRAMFVPLHVVLAGIMLRGAAFVFRNYGPGMQSRERAGDTQQGATLPSMSHYSAWGWVFGIASVVSPLLLGFSFGVATAGEVRVNEAGVQVPTGAWTSLYAVGCAILALLSCAYLAAVYLVVETDGELREDFRTRAIVSGTATAAAAAAVLVAAKFEAPWLFAQLTAVKALPILAIGAVAFALSAVAVFRRWIYAARVFAVAQTVLMLLGWGVAHRDFFLYPDIPLRAAAAPPQTIGFMIVAISIGMAILAPALFYMLRVFKDFAR
jgi:cytochrome bd ubiquinol oxidase subunit II